MVPLRSGIGVKRSIRYQTRAEYIHARMNKWDKMRVRTSRSQPILTNAFVDNPLKC